MMAERWTNQRVRLGGALRFVVMSLLAVAAWSGMAGVAAQLSGTPPGYTAITGLVFDGQGNAFASLAKPTFPPRGPGVIGEINTTTGEFTELGTIPGPITDIALVVPEPGTLALFGLGVLGWLGYRRRRAAP